MAKLYYALHELAKSDLEAANILTQNRLYVQAIYFYAQAFEKSTKSVIALYLTNYENQNEPKAAKRLKDTHGHQLSKLTEGVLRILITKDIKLYKSRGGKETDEFIQTAYKSIDLRSQKYEEDELVALFYDNVRYHYEIFYKSLSGEQPRTLFDWRWGILREHCENPKTRYLKYGTLARILFPLLKDMNTYARYPVTTMNNNNIAFLNSPENKKSCLFLEEMIGELISLEPLVWKQIESIKA